MNDPNTTPRRTFSYQPVPPTVLVDIQIPFDRMVMIIFKFALALLPVLFLFYVAAYLLVMIGALFGRV